MTKPLHVMIVDDEKVVIDEIVSLIDWAAFGIESVHTALGKEQALDIMEHQLINIIISDIEMPRGSGLELLAWVKKNRPNIETIFVTCHADFRYAQQAIQMGSLEFLLKPVNRDELVDALKKAIEKIEKTDNLTHNSRYGQFWAKHQPLLLEHFWIDLLNHDIIPLRQEIARAASERNIPFNIEMEVLPVLISIDHTNDEPALQDDKLLEFSVKNIAEEVITLDGNQGQIIRLRQGLLLGILSLDDPQVIDLTGLTSACQTLTDACRKYLNCLVKCYLGRRVNVQDLSGLVEHLIQHRNNHVRDDQSVIELVESDFAVKPYFLPETDTLLLLLRTGNRSKISENLINCLEELSASQAKSRDLLVDFQQRFQQAIFKFVQEKKMTLPYASGDSRAVELYANSVNSINNLKKWMFYVLDQVFDSIHFNSENQTVTRKVMQYIDQNIDTELNCIDIADYAFISHDYLTKLFKKETGLSLSQYIIKVRIEKSRKLLETTNLSIREIASSIGCDNVSYFSKFFRKHLKISPVEYRASHSTQTRSGKE